jgi:prefoldin subunit 5
MQVEANPRGIPKAPFVDNVQKFLSGSHEETLQKFQEMIQKYRFMENHLNSRFHSISSKIPEISNSLDLVKIIETKQELSVDFEMVETLFCKAKVKASKVNLWLGANVMLEYSVEEAVELLSSKLESATTTLSQVKEDLEYIKEQITTMEVNMVII